MEQKDIKKMKKAELVEFIEKEFESRQQHLNELLAWTVNLFNFLVDNGELSEDNKEIVEYPSEALLPFLKDIKDSATQLADLLGVNIEEKVETENATAE